MPRYIEEIENEPFVANDGGRWFIMQNIDHCDADDNYGMSTEYRGNVHGYDTRAEAEAALASL